ncbi:MAG: PQQ-binding-like beta-propeller repeat protein [Planctomycetota bacterium]
MKPAPASLLAFALLLPCPAVAEDWPQWQGPTRDLAGSETGLLKEWPEGGPPRLWMCEGLGKGYSGPAVVGGVVYLMGADDGAAFLVAVDAESGKEKWRCELAEEFTNGWGDGPRSTPTVDGDNIYAITSRGAVSCVSKAGELVWQTDMLELGGKVPTWGYAESPLVDDRAVYCTPGREQGSIAALDKQTGELIWQSTEATAESHYSSLVSAEINGVPQVVQQLPTVILGVAKDDGRVLWQEPWFKPIAAIPTPIVDGNRVYFTCGYGKGSALYEIGEDFSVTEVYKNKVMKNKHGGVVLIDGYVYGHSNPDGWTCQDFATGKRVWSERSELGMGALGYADGMLYLLDKDTGDVALVEPSPEGYEERGRFTLDPQSEIRKPRGRIWVHPVVSDGKLYLRDQELLFCFDVKAK